MSTSVIIAIVLLIIVFAGIFVYRVQASYHAAGSLVAAIAALLLFLMAVGVVHF